MSYCDFCFIGETLNEIFRETMKRNAEDVTTKSAVNDREGGFRRTREIVGESHLVFNENLQSSHSSEFNFIFIQIQPKSCFFNNVNASNKLAINNSSLLLLIQLKIAFSISMSSFHTHFA
jgi:hypothetical protein